MSRQSPVKAIAKWSWCGENKETDVNFVEQDILEIIKIIDNGETGYGTSMRTKITGYFPMKYVEIIEVKESPSRKNLNIMTKSPSKQSIRADRSIAPPPLPHSSSHDKHNSSQRNHQYTNQLEQEIQNIQRELSAMKEQAQLDKLSQRLRDLNVQQAEQQQQQKQQQQQHFQRPELVHSSSGNLSRYTNERGSVTPQSFNTPPSKIHSFNNGSGSTPRKNEYYSSSSNGNSNSSVFAKNSEDSESDDYSSDEEIPPIPSKGDGMRQFRDLDLNPPLPPLPDEAIANSKLNSSRGNRYLLENGGEFQSSQHSNLPHFSSTYSQAILDSSTSSTNTGRSSYFGHSDFSATSAGSFSRHQDQKYQEQLKLFQESGANPRERQELLSSLNDSKSNKSPNLLKKFFPGSSKKRQQLTLDEKIFAQSSAVLQNDERKRNLNRINLDTAIAFEQFESPLTDRTLISNNETIVRDGYLMNESYVSYNSRSNNRSHSPSPSPSPSPFPELLDLERTRTHTSRDRAIRKNKATSEDCCLILEPHKSITRLNTNEVTPGGSKIEIDSTPLGHVDNFMKRLSHETYATPDIILDSQINEKFANDIEKIRALYIYCIERFDIVSSPPNEEIRSKPPHNIEEIIQMRRCTAHQLTWIFYAMALRMKLEVEIILGYYKTPFDYHNAYANSGTTPGSNSTSKNKGNNSAVTINHSWISIYLGNEFRFIDIALGNPSNPIHSLFNYSEMDLDNNTEYYFLSRPLEIVYTHVPIHIDNQHVTPPIDTNIQTSLPPLYPAFLNNGFSFHKFDQSLLRLHDFEIAELDFVIPKDFIMEAFVERNGNGKSHHNEANRALVQIYWRKGRRIAKIKAVVPPMTPIAFIAVYAAIEGSDNLPLAVSLPIYHQGKDKPLSWVRVDNDFNNLKNFEYYVKQPQVYNLPSKETFEFSIIRYHVKNIETERPFALYLISPRGEYYPFDYQDIDNPQMSIWEQQIQLREEGKWKLIAPSDDNSKWCTIAEWNCF
ncbi:hypothetical protein B5S32_g3830 [[Candida] boidinii]|nr:hypothetical protein B5S29_g4798 [[Candida] boidinii]OWB79601.1 hypothetical protein B5S32_g3830 [[Candida] boidinii]